MTYPSPHPGPPQGQGGSPNSPYAPYSAHAAYAAYAAYGQQPTNAPYAGATYGQMPTPAGQASYAPPEQLAIPTQSVHQPPRAAGIPGQPYPPAQVPAPQYPADPTASPQYQPYQPYQQEYESPGSTYLSGAATAPGYSAGSQSPLRGRPGTQTTSPQTIGTGNYVPWRGEKAAALIMISVFAAFMLIDEKFIVVMGFALAVAVFFDAFIVRMTIIPATMFLLDDRAWRLPRWLDRMIPHVDIEGESLTRKAPVH